MVIHNIINL